jgi:hypothetical protein
MRPARGRVRLYFAICAVSLTATRAVGQTGADGGVGAPGVVSSNTGSGPYPSLSGMSINSFVGATKFYDNGYTGAGTVVANIEAGHAWNGHETLSGPGVVSQ